MSNQTQGTKLLGYIHLQPGLSRMNGWTLVIACLTGIPFLVVINTIQPFILAMLDIPTEQQGSISGYVAVLHELIIIALVGPAGALADRIGRRKVLTVGYLLAGVGLMIYPWATSVTGLILIRCIYAVGAAALVSGASVFLADYPQEKSRGKLVALAGILNGLGILILTTAGNLLPKAFVSAGFAEISAGRMAMFCIAMVGIISGIIIYLGFRGGDLGVRKDENKQSLMTLLKLGIGAARNPRIAVSYASAFAARGDVVVIGTYVSLWVTQAGIADGMTKAEALAVVPMIFGTIQLASLLIAPVIGILNDRINRVSSLIIGMGLAALGYIAFGLQDSPVGTGALLIAVVLGVGQISAILGGTTLVGQESDPEITGATIGVWNFCGAIGTLIGSLVGGLLYDWWRPGAPFLLMGALNFAVMIWAVWVRIKYPQKETLQVIDTQDAG